MKFGVRKSYNEYIGKNFGHLKILDVYRNGKYRMAFCECDCGNRKEINFYNVIQGKTKSCGCYEAKSRFNRKHSDDSIIGKKFGKLKVIKDSGKRGTNGSVLWECVCDCGNTTYVDSSNLKRGHTKSCGCNKSEYVESLKDNIIGQRFGLLTVIKELERSLYKRRTYLCRCDCGNEKIIDGASLTTGHTLSCGCNAMSNGEILVESILKENNIKYEPQFKFEDCKNERCLPFDFYLLEHNVCIEYQGKQHYQVVDYFGGEKGFEERQRNDAIKKKYCIDNGIQLLEIQYGESKENIESMILNVLNP